MLTNQFSYPSNGNKLEVIIQLPLESQLYVKKGGWGSLSSFCITDSVFFSMLDSGLEENLNSSWSFKQAAFTFCLPSYSSYLMILLEDDLPGPFPFGKYALKVTIYLSQTTRREFFRALLNFVADKKSSLRRQAQLAI